MSDYIKSVHIPSFTAFHEFSIRLSAGLNVLIGENSTGKTHLLKLLYTLFRPGENGATPNDMTYKMLDRMFITTDSGPLYHIGTESVLYCAYAHIGSGVRAILGARIGGRERDIITEGIKKNTTDKFAAMYQDLINEREYYADNIDITFIPSKDILGNAPGFRSLYNSREISFETVYYDILDKAFLPLRRQLDPKIAKIVKALEKSIQGEVSVREDTFFFSLGGLDLEATLVAEGYRKLGLFARLLKNGVVNAKSVLLWDEPEANLNPQLMDETIEALLAISRLGAQVIVATHSYVLLKEIDLRMRKTDKVQFHSLYRDPESRSIKVNSVRTLSQVLPNPILNKYAELFDRHIEKELR